MNDTLVVAMRQAVKDGIARCTESQQSLFRRGYSHLNPELPMNEVVDNMSEDKLSSAMSLIERTHRANAQI